ncbi:mediator of RNA polymerase II transcription subunit 1-domain-containing protein [Staphylotrichum tortipilum]|uniref:Mediator of RNA polymerase II transcription subunit 1 n=1 Tax=Staphylotrichum tortipilum TaxID=2831512 RepID=A0AAN6MH86_9PEZI|nr:mediator of RNA polymerase II transcription subunit 1-domain-containing protein [Staphylotrichum longicolle]
MSTPTPGKLPLSQQGKTPSQHHGAAPTPAASTPFSVTQAAFSPLGPRSSPQQVKKSPVTMGNIGKPGPVNFESPSAAAAIGSLDLPAGLDVPGSQPIPNLGRASEDERARRLDAVIAILDRSKGLVSEAGLERLTKKLDLEFMWEKAIGADDKKTLIVAGSALELLVEFSHNLVQSVTLNFPDSAEIVNKHADSAAAILLNDLKLLPGQSPLTKSLGPFAANFEHLAVLDKLSINPGLNLYEAVAGIYESLCRLHACEMQKARETDPVAAAKGEPYLEHLVMSTKSGKPTMNARGCVGMKLDYWRRMRLQPPRDPAEAERAAEKEQTWGIIIGCAALREMGVNPVRISDKWIGPGVEKIPLPGELPSDVPIIDWLEPESTFVPTSDAAKNDLLQPDPSLLGPRLPDVVFHATFEPPVPIPSMLWDQIQQLGCTLEEAPTKGPATFDSLVLPYPAGKGPEDSDTRAVRINKVTKIPPLGSTKEMLKKHSIALYVKKPILSRTLTAMTFSHPQQIITILPYLRQYIFLARLLKKSLTEQQPTIPEPAAVTNGSTTIHKTVTTTQSDFTTFATPSSANTSPSLQSPTTTTTVTTTTTPSPDETPIQIDLTLTMLPLPRIRAIFPFAGRTANVSLAVAENGRVVVESQDVVGEWNAVAPATGGKGDGRRRSGEDVGRVLEVIGEVGGWVEFLRTRWA